MISSRRALDRRYDAYPAAPLGRVEQAVAPVTAGEAWPGVAATVRMERCPRQAPQALLQPAMPPGLAGHPPSRHRPLRRGDMRAERQRERPAALRRQRSPGRRLPARHERVLPALIPRPSRPACSRPASRPRSCPAYPPVTCTASGPTLAAPASRRLHPGRRSVRPRYGGGPPVGGGRPMMHVIVDAEHEAAVAQFVQGGGGHRHPGG